MYTLSSFYIYPSHISICIFYFSHSIPRNLPVLLKKNDLSNFLVFPNYVLPSSSFQASSIIFQYFPVQLYYFPVPCFPRFEIFFIISLFSFTRSKIILSILNSSLPRSTKLFCFLCFLHSCPLLTCCLIFPVFSCSHNFSIPVSLPKIFACFLPF